MNDLTTAQRIRLLELAEKIARDYGDPKEQNLNDRMMGIQRVYHDLVKWVIDNSDSELADSDHTSSSVPPEK